MKAGTEDTYLVSLDVFEKLRDRATEQGTQGLKALDELCRLYRINTLGALMSARHGWLGASFSCIEILAVIYSRFIGDLKLSSRHRNRVIMSKGHAAAAHYAVLAGQGVFPVDDLLRYKDCFTTGGLPAHCDLSVSGVDAGSGSLGMGISKALGMTAADRLSGREHYSFILLGDGELQEGQVQESLLSLVSQAAFQCIPIIDCNGLQSDSQVSEIKGIKDLDGMLSSLGLQVYRINGHSPAELCSTFEEIIASKRVSVVLAETLKGGGTTLTSMSRKTPFGQGQWHGKIPDYKEYLEMLLELAEGCGEMVRNQVKDLAGRKGASSPSMAPGRILSTGEAFGRHITEIVSGNPDGFNIALLDADLRKSCKLDSFHSAFPERFIEMGISEQDMVSLAEGLSLGGVLPVINTYAAFLRRGYDQLWSLVSQRIPALIVGHYSGIDYYTDGKSHQSLNDAAMMRSLGIETILEPFDPERTGQALNWALSELQGAVSEGRPMKPIYLRLHRTPLSFELSMSGSALQPFCLKQDETGTWNNCDEIGFNLCLFCSDPHLVNRAMVVLERLKNENRGISAGICILPGIVPNSNVHEGIRRIIDASAKVLILDGDASGCGISAWIQEIARGSLTWEKIETRLAVGSANSTRTLEQMLDLQGFGCDELITSCRR